MTDRSHRHADTVRAIRESIRAEIEWREQLIEQYLCSNDPTMHDVSEVYAHLKRKNNGDAHLHPGGDSWATVRTKDILREFDVWDDESNCPVYSDATRIPLSEFAYMNEDGLDVDYIERLVAESSVPDADVTCIDGVAYISKVTTAGETVRFEVEIDFFDLEETNGYNQVMRETRELKREIDMEECDHNMVPDPGLEGTPAEGDLMVCEDCTHVKRIGGPKPYEPNEAHPSVTRHD